MIFLSEFSVLLLLAVVKMLEIDFDDSDYTSIAIILLICGVGLIIASAVCILLVSHLFWIMTGFGIASTIVGIVLFSWDDFRTYIVAVATGIGVCAFAFCNTYFIYEAFHDGLSAGFASYNNGFLYREYNDDYEELSEELRGGDTIFGYSDKSKKNINLPTEIKGRTVVSVHNCSFRNGSRLKGIGIPDTVVKMYKDAFKYCTSLTSVHYYGSVDEWCSIKFENEKANPLYFAENLYVEGEKVVDLKISDDITEIGDFAFYNCKGIKSLTLPTSVVSLGSSAFFGCESLTKISYGGTKSQWNSIDKGEKWNYLTGYYTVVCSDGELIK